MEGAFLKQRGGYRKLKAYKVAKLIDRITYYFTSTYLDSRERTVDQMVQASRSCKQNMVEGSAAGTGSTETEIKLTGVARSRLEELLEDYEVSALLSDQKRAGVRMLVHPDPCPG